MKELLHCEKCNIKESEAKVFERYETRSLCLCTECSQLYNDHLNICNKMFIQPERSKREDSLVCCEILNKLKDIFQDHKLLDVVREEYKNFIKEYEMRCSEHCGNTVRGK